MRLRTGRRGWSRIGTGALATAFTALAFGCPSVGSERWCKQLEDTPKGDWSTDDAVAYAKHCILR